ncbi:hypothetical protein HYX14_05310 [Candidatus Woesearchaeota archaeon]|nr:hypothetical protein [Candidatus Woesearchaeota archaeon]
MGCLTATTGGRALATFDKALLLKKSMHTTEFVKLLSAETRKEIREVPKKEWVEFATGVQKAEWKRKKYLTQA